MGTLGVGTSVRIPNFKLNDGRKIALTATIVASTNSRITVDLSA